MIKDEHKGYRYPGIIPFTSEDRNVFFGRDHEVEELLSMVALKPLVVLFSASGLGKTSLLQAGLNPLLEGEGYFPILIRLQNMAISPADAVCNRLEPYLQKGLDTEQQKVQGEAKIWERLHACSFSGKHGQELIPVLIFDQFEELFNHSLEARQQLSRQLADLIHQRLPRELQQALKELPRNQRTPENLAKFQAPKAKVLFAIRSDKMSVLHQLRHDIPAILHNRYELKPLSADEARKAIQNPASETKGNFLTLPFTYQAGTVQAILENLANDEQEIESFQLQIICQHIELEVEILQQAGMDKVRVAPELVGGAKGIKDIISNYYYNQISKFAEEDKKKIEILLQEGLTVDRRRIAQSEASIIKDYEIDPVMLDQLVQSRLIRPESTRLGTTFEISHDTLLAPILESLEQRKLEEEREENKKRLKQEQDRLEVQRLRTEQEMKLRQQAEASAQKARQQTRLARFGTFFALLAAILAITQFCEANSQRRQAEESTLQALESAKEAEEAQKKAERNADERDAVASQNEKLAATARDNEDKARREQRRAESTLRDLLSASQLIYDIFLENGERDILTMNYDSAEIKFQEVQKFKVDNNSRLINNLFEIGFVYLEAGRTSDALRIVNNILSLKKRTNSLQLLNDLSKEELKTQLSNLDPNLYRRFSRRYFPDLVSVRGGPFLMGCDNSLRTDCPDKELPLHRVAVGDFAIAKTETTNWQYNLYCLATNEDDIENKKQSWTLLGELPVVGISRDNAMKYTNWLNRTNNLPENYKWVLDETDGTTELDINDIKAKGYRLPTEAEWEYAAGGGSQNKRYLYSGNDRIDLVAWFSSNSNNRPHRVVDPNIAPNDLGLHGMSGNAWEWCQDNWFHSFQDRADQSSIIEDGGGPKEGRNGVLRGGSYSSLRGSCYVSSRTSGFPVRGKDTYSFRVVMGR